MITLRTYFWKEWREQRQALFLSQGLLLVAFVAGIYLFVPSRLLSDPHFSATAALCFFLGTLLAVGGELLSERRSGGLAWLERLPAGLGQAFAAKLLFLAALFLVIVVFDYLVAAVALGLHAASRGVELEDCTTGLVLLLKEWSAAALFLGAPLALWTFATSSWSSRSVIALFGAGFVLALFGAPLWYVLWNGYRPQKPWELVAAWSLITGGALVSAWQGFVRGGRLGRSAGAAALRGLGVAALAFVPIWCWAGFRLYQREHIEPYAPGFAIQRAFVTRDGSKAFLEVSTYSRLWADRSIPDFVLQVDLDTGSWRQVGARNARVTAVRGGEVYDIKDPLREEGVTFSALDGVPVEIEEPLSADAPDRERAGRWHLAHAPGYTETSIRCPITSRCYSLEAYSLPRDAKLWIGRPGWFVDSPKEGWSELDPDRGARRSLPWLRDVDQLGPALPDGRFFAALSSGGVGLVDCASARVSKVFTSEPLHYLWNAYTGDTRPFAEDQVVLLGTGQGILRFDEGRSLCEVVPLISAGRLVCSLEDGSIIYHSLEGALWHLDPRTGERRQLFPRFGLTPVADGRMLPRTWHGAGSAASSRKTSSHD